MISAISVGRRQVAQTTAPSEMLAQGCARTSYGGIYPVTLRLADQTQYGDNAHMAGTPTVYSPESMRAEKRAVAGNSVLASWR